MARAATESGILRLDSELLIKLAFCESSVNSNGGLMLNYEPDDALGLTVNYQLELN